MSATNPVKQLNAETARKIAAGEVIERPSSIVRELMDNAIDSGADTITVEITGGGIEKIRIVDNGSGMTKEDLAACARPHATSKIEHENDLLKLTTLGFRGEALASIAAVARLSIASGGWKMRASITEDHLIDRVAETKGTIVMSEGLFENFPARRVFLKRPQSEGVMCKNTFVEKAMAHPNLAFKFSNDGETKLDLRGKSSQKTRFMQALQLKESEDLFYEIDINDNPDYSAKVIIGEPSVYRSNKKDIYIFVNGRRIQEYSLVQAVEYGGQGFFPNGTYPVAGVFLKVDPKLVDFNIHPAKKEARFTDISAIHHSLSSGVRQFFHNYTVKAVEEKVNYSTPVQMERESYIPDFFTASKEREVSKLAHKAVSHSYSENAIPSFTQSLAMEALSTENSKKNEIPFFKNEESEPVSIQKPLLQEEIFQPVKNSSPFKFLGSALGTFLVCEKDDTLYIIDKHAAHERILYDKIMEGDGGTVNLLFPYEIRTENDAQTEYVKSIEDELTKFGFSITQVDDYLFHITTTPDRWKGNNEDLSKMILEDRISPQELIAKIAASTACKAAVKDGWILEDVDAAELAQKALELPDPHCPHGRPVFYMLTREKLFHLVRRTE
ncbi:MAG: DNA mismatch repair endonuclease MutL [Treponema sp.]|nr:DNA mismatch repair endonuclease MutL [Treponema sp.]